MLPHEHLEELLGSHPRRAQRHLEVGPYRGRLEEVEVRRELERRPDRRLLSSEE